MERNQILLFVLAILGISALLVYATFRLVKTILASHPKPGFQLLIKIHEGKSEIFLDHQINLDDDEFFLGMLNAFQKLKFKDRGLLNYLSHASLIALSDHPAIMSGLKQAMDQLSHQENQGQFFTTTRAQKKEKNLTRQLHKKVRQ